MKPNPSIDWTRTGMAIHALISLWAFRALSAQTVHDQEVLGWCDVLPLSAQTRENIATLAMAVATKACDLLFQLANQLRKHRHRCVGCFA